MTTRAATWRWPGAPPRPSPLSSLPCGALTGTSGRSGRAVASAASAVPTEEAPASRSTSERGERLEERAGGMEDGRSQRRQKEHDCNFTVSRLAFVV